MTRDTSNTTTYPPHPSDSGPPFPVYGHPGPNQSTYVVQHDVTNTNTNTHHPGPVYPANTGYPSPQHTGPGPKQTYLYKREVTNTKNTVYGPPGGPGGSGGPAQPQPIIEYPSHDGYPSPKTGPTTATYNYTTNTVTRNVHGIHPDDRQPLLQPRPFPVDGGVPTSQVDGNPPKRLDDLLATFGDVSVLYNCKPRSNVHILDLNIVKWQWTASPKRLRGRLQYVAAQGNQHGAYHR